MSVTITNYNIVAIYIACTHSLNMASFSDHLPLLLGVDHAVLHVLHGLGLCPGVPGLRFLHWWRKLVVILGRNMRTYLLHSPCTLGERYVLLGNSCFLALLVEVSTMMVALVGNVSLTMSALFL